MNINILKKIFPEPLDGNYSGLYIDNEGLYSITHPKDADLISQTIIKIMKTSHLHILDMTAGCGGNMISFLKHFYLVTGIEINKERFEYLKKNISKYNYQNYQLMIGDATMPHFQEYDVYFIDAPWGGPEYKKNDNIELYLSEMSLNEIVHTIIPNGKLIVLKLPFNYNINIYEKYIIEKIFINNIIILYINIYVS